MSDSLNALAERAGIEPTFTDYWGRETHVSDATKHLLVRAMGYDERDFGGPSTSRTQDQSPIETAGPSRCYLSPRMEAGRIWALAVQLYGLRSACNWGIGDFSDLAALGQIVGAAGGGAVAINPLHELHPSNPDAASPYAPSSRLFLNTLYIDVTAVPEFRASADARALAASSDFARELASVRESVFVDYAGVAAAKRKALELCHRHFREHRSERAERRRSFERFVARGGAQLERLARYEALAEDFRSRDTEWYGWQQWPPEYRSPGAPEVEAFAAARRERVDFFLYLQWLADEQLASASRACAQAGVVLYRDLAVGVDRNSADAWADQEALVCDASLGAPPDALNALGQNWGLPPLSPRALAERDFEPFAALLRANMHHAGILRIDHVMALRRAFWIPRGRPAVEGAYVRYPFDQMLEVLARESTERRCAIVGEDLGTVPSGFRDRMRSACALSTRLLYFERNWEHGSFLPPSAYPRHAAAGIGTHDLPPLAGWWTGDDIALRVHLALYPGEQTAHAAATERNLARFALVDALQQHGALEGTAADQLRADAQRGGTREGATELIPAAHRFLALTPCALLVVQLEDVLGQVDAVNVPGTWDQHPNWRRKYSAPLEELQRDTHMIDVGKTLAS